MRHCDDYIDDKREPLALRTFLAHARQPAIDKMGEDQPPLFATAAKTILGNQIIYEGETVRVVMASRLGDVGVTRNLDSEHGYGARVELSALTNFREQP